MSGSRPFRILFVTGNRLGDVVLSSGVLAQLVAAHPGARVTVACGALAAPLFADLPGLERVHVMVKRRRGGHWLDLWRATVGRRWDAVVDVRGALFAWTVRARRRLVARAQKRREHRIEELRRLLRLSTLPHPRLWVSPERDRRAAALLGEGPVLAIGPTANWGGKQWPADRYAALAQRLTAPAGILPGARVAVFAAAAERAQAEPVLAPLPAQARLDLIGMPDLLDVFAVLRRCSLYIGNDSGLTHLAACAGIPTLALFGPTAEWRYGPWGERTAVARPAESYEEMVASPRYDWRSHATMMDVLAVESVAEAAERLWRRLHP